jgi:hypothetical protein
MFLMFHPLRMHIPADDMHMQMRHAGVGVRAHADLAPPVPSRRPRLGRVAAHHGLLPRFVGGRVLSQQPLQLRSGEGDGLLGLAPHQGEELRVRRECVRRVLQDVFVGPREQEQVYHGFGVQIPDEHGVLGVADDGGRREALRVGDVFAKSATPFAFDGLVGFGGHGGVGLAGLFGFGSHELGEGVADGWWWFGGCGWGILNFSGFGGWWTMVCEVILIFGEFGVMMMMVVHCGSVLTDVDWIAADCCLETTRVSGETKKMNGYLEAR